AARGLWSRHARFTEEWRRNETSAAEGVAHRLRRHMPATCHGVDEHAVIVVDDTLRLVSCVGTERLVRIPFNLARAARDERGHDASLIERARRVQMEHEHADTPD